MQSNRPQLIDPTALARMRARARPQDAAFLIEAAQDELQERLIDVNRTFTAPALVTPFPFMWEGFIPHALRIAPDELLQIDPGAHDLVIHAMALHWAEDPVGQIVQCARGLAPDGLFLGVCLGGETLSELRSCLAQAETDVTGGLSPRIAPMAEIRDLGQLLGRAGLALPVADTQRLTASYPSLAALGHDLRAMGERNTLNARLRHPTRPSIFARTETLYRTNFPAEPGRMAATFDLMFLTAWKPHLSQQQPLRPGSAKTRLADALETQEYDEGGALFPDAHPPKR